LFLCQSIIDQLINFFSPIYQPSCNLSNIASHLLTYNVEFEEITKSGAGPVTLVSVDVCRNAVATEDVSDGEEVVPVRTAVERVSTNK